MSLDDLTARELAHIDSVCLEYEQNYRRGNASDISDIVALQGGLHPNLLRKELELVRDELQSGETIGGTAQGDQPTPSSSFRVPAVGTELGPYVVGETIGRGGMGVVLAATDMRLDRRVAIKLLASELAQSGDLTERFDREARSVANISHPNIVELFDIGSYDGLPYAVMEFLDGELLSDRMNRQPFSIEETRDLGIQIADALSKAHESGVIHRDLKPQNIMLVPRSGAQPADQSKRPHALVKLFDFGLSRAPRGQLPIGAEETQEGVILGTPGYMAPEQALGESATPSADIFALGCILFEAFYHKRAFEGSTKIKRHQATLVKIPEPDPIRRRQDAQLGALIEQCLSKDPIERPGSATEIVQRLSQPRTHSIHDSMQAGESAGRFTRRRLIELAVGGTAGATFAAMLASQRPNKLAGIERIGVLSFTEPAMLDDSDQTPTVVAPRAIGDTPLNPGEELSAMLVHELTRISNIIVPPFRPLRAGSPREYEQAGALLNVDALIDGTIRSELKGSKSFLIFDVRLVSAQTGEQLWSKQIIKNARVSLLEKSLIASEIAAEIGLRLTASADEDAPPDPKTFYCLVDGKVRCDPDSPEGLKMALMCFQHAHDADPRFAEPLAGIALTAVTLAAQSSDVEAADFMGQAQDAIEEALELDERSFDARLAMAMLDWQRTARYAQAGKAFIELLTEMPNNWQVYHQHALLQLAEGKIDLAIDSLNAASLRNPFSVTVKTDLARAYWFAGDRDRAVNDAIRIRDKSDRHELAVGLLIDIYEQQGEFAKAAAEDGSLEADSPQDYFQQRQQRLDAIPYGPFGVELNAAILQARSASELDPDLIAGLIDPPRPAMLPLVLAVHPSFTAAREFERVKEVLPPVEPAL